MSKIEQLDKLEKTLKDAEIHLKSIESTMEKIDKELVALGARKNELENNIAFHKKQSTIPLVNEHRKSKTELSKITTRFNLVTADKLAAIRALAGTKEVIEKFKKAYSEIYNQNNVVPGIFGAKNEKK